MFVILLLGLLPRCLWYCVVTDWAADSPDGSPKQLETRDVGVGWQEPSSGAV